MDVVRDETYFDLEDKLDRGATEVMLIARQWTRRQKYAVKKKIVDDHSKAIGRGVVLELADQTVIVTTKEPKRAKSPRS